MSNRQVFTRPLPPPDPGALSTAVVGIVGACLITPELDAAGTWTATVDKATAWVPADVVAVQSAVKAAAAGSPPLAQQRDVDGMPIAWKALALALLDQINIIRAALPAPLPAITPAQALAAIRAKAGTL